MVKFSLELTPPNEGEPDKYYSGDRLSGAVVVETSAEPLLLKGLCVRLHGTVEVLVKAWKKVGDTITKIPVMDYTVPVVEEAAWLVGGSHAMVNTALQTIGGATMAPSAILDGTGLETSASMVSRELASETDVNLIQLDAGVHRLPFAIRVPLLPRTYTIKTTLSYARVRYWVEVDVIRADSTIAKQRTLTREVEMGGHYRDAASLALEDARREVLPPTKKSESLKLLVGCALVTMEVQHTVLFHPRDTLCVEVTVQKTAMDDIQEVQLCFGQVVTARGGVKIQKTLPVVRSATWPSPQARDAKFKWEVPLTMDHGTALSMPLLTVTHAVTVKLTYGNPRRPNITNGATIPLHIWDHYAVLYMAERMDPLGHFRPAYFQEVAGDEVDEDIPGKGGRVGNGGTGQQRGLAVVWQRDDEARECPTCQKPFNFHHRRHHCRVCGMVYCAKGVSKVKVSSLSPKKVFVCQPCQHEAEKFPGGIDLALWDVRKKRKAQVVRRRFSSGVPGASRDEEALRRVQVEFDKFYSDPHNIDRLYPLISRWAEKMGMLDDFDDMTNQFPGPVGLVAGLCLAHPVKSAQVYRKLLIERLALGDEDDDVTTPVSPIASNKTPTDNKDRINAAHDPDEDDEKDEDGFDREQLADEPVSSEARKRNQYELLCAMFEAAVEYMADDAAYKAFCDVACQPDESGQPLVELTSAPRRSILRDIPASGTWLDMLWGQFCAAGDPDTLKVILNIALEEGTLKNMPSNWANPEMSSVVLRSAAVWSLTSQATKPHHLLIRQLTIAHIKEHPPTNQQAYLAIYQALMHHDDCRKELEQLPKPKSLPFDPSHHHHQQQQHQDDGGDEAASGDPHKQRRGQTRPASTFSVSVIQEEDDEGQMLLEEDDDDDDNNNNESNKRPDSMSSPRAAVNELEPMS